MLDAFLLPLPFAQLYLCTFRASQSDACVLSVEVLPARSTGSKVSLTMKVLGA